MPKKVTEEDVKELAAELAEMATQHICEVLDIDCIEMDDDGNESFTDEAQDHFNHLFDEMEAHLVNSKVVRVAAGGIVRVSRRR